MNVPKSPITLLVEAIQGSERMKGVEVHFGARDLPEAGSPCRIVLTPSSETYVPPENNDNWADAPLAITAHCWGESFDVVRYLRDALLQCCFDYQFSTNLLRLSFVGGEHEPGTDTAQDGWGLLVNFTIRDVVEKVPLAAAAGSALVVNEQFAPADSSTPGPTVTYPP